MKIDFEAIKQRMEELETKLDNDGIISLIDRHLFEFELRILKTITKE